MPEKTRADLALEMSLEFLRQTVLENDWIPHTPTPKQGLFLTLPHDEAFYGGAAGGGKSDALLMAALQFVHVPNYSALLLRKTFSDLALPGALMDKAHEWLRGTAARWVDRDRKYVFPSGATINFGYLESENDKFRYKSAEFQFVGFDELTQFSETQYLYLFSRMRRLKDSDVPLRMRGASNPGDAGHEWVKQRFVEPRCKDRPFISANLVDNPHLDEASYRESLAKLDPNTRRQLEEGDWSEPYPDGAYFKTQMEQADKEGRICEVPWEPALPVHTFWDLGIAKGRDSMVVGFMQPFGLQCRWIRAYGVSGEGFPHMASYLQGLGYKYGQHYAPHDISVKELGTGKSRLETARSLGINFREVPDIGVDNGINALRMILHRCVWDRRNCSTLIRALRNYQKEWDDKGNCFKANPVKDWTNDWADMMRMFGVGWQERKSDGKPKIRKTYDIFARRSA